MNVVFLLIAIAATFVPRDRLIERVRSAFASGDLGFIDYRFFDSRRGFNQYNDCAVLQMIANGSHDHLADAVGPIHFLSDFNGDAQCRTLLAVMDGKTTGLILTRHARYWHGYNVVATGLLTLFSLAEVRWVLRVFVYVLAIAFPLLALRIDRKVGLAASTVSVAMLAFYAMPYFEQSLTHAPGDICILAGLILMIVNGSDVIFFCAIFGSLFAYFDDLIGVIPIGTAFFFIFAYLTKRRWRSALEAIAGLAVGGVITIAAKQIFTLAVLGQSASADFMQHLAFYVAPAHHVLRAPHFIAAILARIPLFLPFAMLLNATRMLTYGSRVAGAVLLGATACAWVAAAVIAWRSKETRNDFLAFLLAGVGIFIGWVLVAQTHTYEHAVFMVRIEIIPIALGWAALTWAVVPEASTGAARLAPQSEPHNPGPNSRALRGGDPRS
jgi:hypothetical protein